MNHRSEGRKNSIRFFRPGDINNIYFNYKLDFETNNKHTYNSGINRFYDTDGSFKILKQENKEWKSILNYHINDNNGTIKKLMKLIIKDTH